MPLLRRVPVAVLIALCLAAAACTPGDTDPPVVTDVGSEAPDTAAREAPRCEVLDYPCAWTEVDAGTIDTTEALAGDLEEAMQSAPDPDAAMTAARSLLEGRDDLVEWGVDAEDNSGVMFRIEGAAPAVVSTPRAAGTPGQASSWTTERLESQQSAVPARTSAPPSATDAPSATLVDYRPAGGPLEEPRRALVLEPLGGETCDGWWTGPGQVGCRRTGDDRSEGEAVAATLRQHDQIEVSHLRLGEVTPDVILGLGQFDLVHVASHAVRICGPDITTYIRNAEPQDDACFAAIHLGPQTPEEASATIDEMREEGVTGLPGGLAYVDGGWGMTASVLNEIGGLEDTIVYLSTCVSADDEVLDTSDLGGFVGWSNYVRVDAALDAALRFWEVMGLHGTTVDLAAKVLAAEGDDSALSTSGWAELTTASARNLRARDVVHDSIATGDRLAVSGEVDGDGPVVLPQLSVWLEGVEAGTEGDVTVELRIDDRTVEHDIDVRRDGTVFYEGEGFSHWRVDLEDIELPVQLTSADVAPASPREHTWEVRAYTEQERYTAQRADPVFLGGEVIARADPAPTSFAEYLGATEATVDLSDLYMVLPVGGGEVDGELEAVYELDGGPEPTRSILDISGTFDPETMEIEGAADSVETIDDLHPMPPVNATLNGVVDLEAGRIDVVIGGTMAWWPEPIRFTAEIGGSDDDPPTSVPGAPNA